MKPDISEIIKVSLRIVKYIQFYVPRTLQLEELFGIISEIKGTNRIFFDIHILKSANKINAQTLSKPAINKANRKFVFSF